jgi:hypothetical protein
VAEAVSCEDSWQVARGAEERKKKRQRRWAGASFVIYCDFFKKLFFGVF